MKTLFWGIAFLLLCTPLAAQEMLFLVNGDSARIKLQEVGLEAIRYTLYEYENQAVIHTPVKQVGMIRYANGYEQHFNQMVAGPRPLPAKKPVQPSVAGAPQAASQPAPQATPQPATPPAEPLAATNLVPRLRLGGPRMGATYVASGPAYDYLKAEGIPPLLTQFGWQFETRFFQTAAGHQGMLEFVPMVGGLEQGRFIPSFSTLMALRMPSGFEFGLGPQFYPRVNATTYVNGTGEKFTSFDRGFGTAVVLALGKNFRAGEINFPVNLAVVPAIDGIRASLVVGFNAAKPRENTFFSNFW